MLMLIHTPSQYWQILYNWKLQFYLLMLLRENESDYMNGRQAPQQKQTLSNWMEELKHCAMISMAFQSPWILNYLTQIQNLRNRNTEACSLKMLNFFFNRIACAISNNANCKKHEFSHRALDLRECGVIRNVTWNPAFISYFLLQSWQLLLILGISLRWRLHFSIICTIFLLYLSSVRSFASIPIRLSLFLYCPSLCIALFL